MGNLNFAFVKKWEQGAKLAVAGLLMYGGGKAVIWFFPILLHLTLSLLGIGVLVGGGLLLGRVLLSSKTWMMGNVILNGIAKSVVGLFIRNDPIGVLEYCVRQFKKGQKIVHENLKKVKDALQQVNRTIDENERAQRENLLLAKQAKDRHQDLQVALYAKRAGRRQFSNDQYVNLRNMLEKNIRLLQKIDDVCAFHVEDIEDQVGQAAQRREIMGHFVSAIRSARAILTGGTFEQSLYQQTMESLAQEQETRLGEINDFMDVSKTLMDSFDLQQGVYEEAGMKLFTDAETKIDKMIEAPLKELPAPTGDNVIPIMSGKAKEGVPVVKDDQFSSLFGKSKN